MNRKPLLFLTLLFFFFSFSSPIAATCQNLYVSPSGNDNNSGALNAPFRSLTKAQEQIRALLQSSKEQSITVYLRAGTYYLPNPLTFSAADSPSSDNQLTITSYPGEQAIISGAHILNNTWTLDGSWPLDGTPIWAYSANNLSDEYDNIHQLFRGETRVLPSRLPGYQEPLRYHVTEISQDKLNTRLDGFPVPSDLGSSARLKSFIEFLAPNVPIVSVSGNIVSTLARAQFPIPAGLTLPYDLTANRDSAVIENVKLEVTPPPPDNSVFEFDRTRQVIRVRGSVKPSPGEYLVPLLDQLINIDGATNLNFTSLTFAHARGWKMTHFSNGDYYYVTQGGLRVLNKDAFYESVAWSPSAVSITNSQNIAFTNNNLRHVGGVGLSASNNVRNIIIDDNTISDVGSICSVLGTLWNPPHSTQINFTNNVVSECGIIDPSAVGVWAGFLQNSNISNNALYNLPYTGLSLGWWGPYDKSPNVNSNTNNIVANNTIHDVCQLMHDCGGIYTLGVNTHSLLDHNLVYDIRLHPQSASNSNMGIYLDANSFGFTIRNNVVYGVVNPAYHLWYQTDPTVAVNLNSISASNNTLGIPPDGANFPKEILTSAGPHLISSILPVCTSTNLGGDLNNDGSVNASDYTLFLTGFGNKYTILDYANLLANYHK